MQTCPCLQLEPGLVDRLETSSENLAEAMREFAMATGLCPIAMRQFLLHTIAEVLPPGEMAQLAVLLQQHTAMIKG